MTASTFFTGGPLPRTCRFTERAKTTRRNSRDWRGGPAIDAEPRTAECSGAFVSEGALAVLARANTDHVADRRHENLAVADLPGVGRVLDRFDRAFHLIVGDDDFELHLRDEVDLILGATVVLGLPLLPAEPLHLAHRETLDAGGGEARLHLVEPERLDDRLDL